MVFNPFTTMCRFSDTCTQLILESFKLGLFPNYLMLWLQGHVTLTDQSGLASTLHLAYSSASTMATRWQIFIKIV